MTRVRSYTNITFALLEPCSTRLTESSFQSRAATKFASKREPVRVYALGRPVEGTDREAIDNVVAAAKRDGATLRSMIQNIAATKAFQTKTTAAY